ncbi:2-amino-4-hydroxy-6-hydroxymethyldihydropteridine diphosphokinase [Bacillus gobiensis]|uniref:2-amino-4-hydroxy-6- hydroxymethyldihydropteridine diphosphokinase n=1 Tax=Bacillus gobiensis TaxID=1441095 RepID=UPI003D21AEF1
MNNIVYVALGSNMGDREAYLRSAVSFIHQHPHVKVDAVSSIYETDPVGYDDQDLFLNMVISLSTSLDPFELLQFLLKTEAELDRERTIRWGPRTVDLDILLYNEENIETEQLIIPHPRMHERLFVLIPLKEIKPDLTEGLINKRTDQEGVRIWRQRTEVDEFVHTES